MRVKALDQSSDKMMLYLKTAEAIRGYIRENELKPGDKLPGERTLSELLCISRNSLREGLRLLDAQGIVNVRTGLGSFVGNGADNEALVFQVLSRNFTEILEIKTLLERHVIESIPDTINSEQKEQLKAIACKMQESICNDVYPQEQDWEFHRLLAKMQGNSIIQEMLMGLINVLDNYWGQTNTNSIGLIKTIPYHISLINCLLNSDKEGALRNYDPIYSIDIKILTEAGVK